MPQSVGGDLPHPERSARGAQPQVERPVGKWRPRIPRKHKLRRREADPTGSHDASAFNALLNVLPLKERRTQGACNRHVLEANCDPAKAIPPGARILLPLKPS